MTEPPVPGTNASESQYVAPATARTQLNSVGGKTIGAAYNTPINTQQNNTGNISGAVSQIPGGASQFVQFNPGEVTVPDANVTAPFTALGLTLT